MLIAVTLAASLSAPTLLLHTPLAIAALVVVLAAVGLLLRGGETAASDPPRPEPRWALPARMGLVALVVVTLSSLAPLTSDPRWPPSSPRCQRSSWSWAHSLTARRDLSWRRRSSAAVSGQCPARRLPRGLPAHCPVARSRSGIGRGIGRHSCRRARHVGGGLVDAPRRSVGSVRACVASCAPRLVGHNGWEADGIPLRMSLCGPSRCQRSALKPADGRVLLRDVHLRVGEGAKVALIGPNGTGKTTLTRIIAGDLAPDEGAVTRSGGLAVMRQFIGKVRDNSTVRDLLLSVAPQGIRVAAAESTAPSSRSWSATRRPTSLPMRRLCRIGPTWGYDWETHADVCTIAALGVPFEQAQWRKVSTLSGGEQKRVVLESLLRGPEEVLLLDEPDNYLDVPGKRWLEEQLRASPKTVLFISHDRELLDQVATRIATLEPSAGGNSVWVHPGRFATYEQARIDRNDKLDECAVAGTRST